MADERLALGCLAAAIDTLHRHEDAPRPGRVAQQEGVKLRHAVRNVRRAGRAQLFLRAVAVGHADGVDAVARAALDIVAAVADHDAPAAEQRHRPADDFDLAGMLRIHARADNRVKIWRHAEFFCDPLGKDLRLRRRNGDLRAVELQAPQQRRDTRIDLIFRPADARKALAIQRHRLLRLHIIHAHDRPEGMIQRRADEGLELLLGIARKAHLFRGVERGAGDALLRTGERSIQIKQNRCICHAFRLRLFR